VTDLNNLTFVTHSRNRRRKTHGTKTYV